MQQEDIDRLVEKLQEELAYCHTCQPYDDGEVVWMLGVESDLEELFDQCEVPEDMRDELAQNLHCRNCGRQFERYDTYGAKTEREKIADKKYQEWYARYGYQLEEFERFIEKYPYLGSHHELGKIIIEIMPKFPAIDITESQWFRARSIRDGRIFSQENMAAPDTSKVEVSEGRFNHFGQSHFYLADTELGAAIETTASQPDEKLVWMQKVYIHKASAILDVRVGFGEPDPDAPLIPAGLIYYSRSFNAMVDRNKYWKPEYFVPRFVADAAKLAGFQGIVFTSTHSYSDNLVLFDVTKIKFEFVDQPYIFNSSSEKEDGAKRQSQPDQ